MKPFQQPVRANQPMCELNAMESSFTAVNSANAARFSVNSELKTFTALSLYILTHRKGRFVRRLGSNGLSSLRVREDLNSKGMLLTVSPSPSLRRLSLPPTAPPSLDPRTLRFDNLMITEHGHVCLGHRIDLNLKLMIVEKLIIMKLILHDAWPRHFEQLKSQYLQRLLTGGRKGFIHLIAVIICLTCPNIVFTNFSIGISDNVALAQPIGQIRQAAVFLEQFARGSTSTRVLDKVMTVITGQTVVTPETVEQLKSIIDGEQNTGDWQTDLANKAETLWSTTLDVASHFDPLSLMEATGNGIQGLVETAAERFAAFELSSLVALGERWILWTPFVVLPMYWQMKQNRSDDDGEKSQPATFEVSEEAMAKAARVRDELERIELKASLLDLVYSLGKLAWQSSGTDQNMKRKQIDDILARLQELNPTSSSALGSAQIESMYTQPAMDVDGEWNLIYVSQTSNQSQQTQLPRFPNLDIPGVELGKLQQKLWRKGSRLTLPTSNIEAELMLAKNTAQVRLGPLGVVEISVRGSWENRRNGKSALVSFDTFSAKPIEVLGSLVREDFPPLDVSIPRTLQTSGEWETIYLDRSLRINRGRTGQLYLFRKTQ